jgi:hypothetical protein
MPDDTDTYAPQSPDLSTFFSAPQNNDRSANTTAFAADPAWPETYAPRSPDLPPSFIRHESLSSQAQLPSYRNSFPDYSHTYAAHQRTQSAPYLPPLPELQQTPSDQQSIFPPYAARERDAGSYPHIKSEDSARSYSTEEDFAPKMARTARPRADVTYKEEASEEDLDIPVIGAPVKMENGAAGPTASGMGPSMGIEVKTKFPVARIKRIMQADEEVGKVAQVTPVAVCTSSPPRLTK